MARKLCTICNLRPVGSGHDAGYQDESFCRQQGYCLPCGNEGQHEISHDNGHETITEDDCWLCNPEMNEALADYKPRTGHTNTVAKTRGSHAGCSHETSPKARAACRKARAADRVGDEAPVRALVNMKKADSKVKVVTRVEDLPKPKLTPAQLDSPVFQSLLRKRKV